MDTRPSPHQAIAAYRATKRGATAKALLTRSKYLYELDLDRFLQWDAERLWTLDAEGFTEHLAWLTAVHELTMTASATARVRSTLTGFYRYAAHPSRAWIYEPPDLGTSGKGRLPETGPRISLTERERVIEAVALYEAPARRIRGRYPVERDKAFLRLMLGPFPHLDHRGLRTGQLRRLLLADLHLDRPQPSLDVPGHGEGWINDVPLTKVQARSLADYLPHRAHDPQHGTGQAYGALFTSINGQPLSSNEPGRIIRAVCTGHDDLDDALAAGRLTGESISRSAPRPTALQAEQQRPHDGR